MTCIPVAAPSTHCSLFCRYTYTRWQSPPPVPVSVALLFRKLVLVAAERLTILCSDNILQVPPLVIELVKVLVFGFC
jgi:hypothetical protein